MGKVVLKCGIKREPGYLYYINKDGNVAMVKMNRKGRKKKKAAKKPTRKKVVKRKAVKRTVRKRKR